MKANPIRRRPHGKPIFEKAGSRSNVAENFCWWYHDVGCSTRPARIPPTPRRLWLDTGNNLTTLTLAKQATNVYQFSSGAFLSRQRARLERDPATTETNNNCAGTGPKFPPSPASSTFPFTLPGWRSTSPVTTTSGLHRRQVAVDIGGVHGAQNGSVTLNAAKAVELNLTVGKLYVISMFQAGAPHLRLELQADPQRFH